MKMKDLYDNLEKGKKKKYILQRASRWNPKRNYNPDSDARLVKGITWNSRIKSTNAPILLY